MPSKTLKQHKAMCAACHGTGRSKINKDVACEFCKADKGKFKKSSVRDDVKAAYGKHS